MQPLPLIRLTFPQVRQVLERCGCSFSVFAEYAAMRDVDGAPTPAVYIITRAEREAMIHVWNDSWIVPVNDLRSVCNELDLELDIFNTMH